MSYAQELADVRAIIAAAGGAIGALHAASLVAWPGEEFSPPQPSGDSSSPVTWIDIERGYIGSEPRVFGSTRAGRTIRSVWDFGVMCEAVPGADYKCSTLVDALDTLFTSKDSSTMRYRIEEAAPGFEGIWQGVWWRRDWRIPVDRYD